jgi:hypothetical protein
LLLLTRAPLRRILLLLLARLAPGVLALLELLVHLRVFLEADVLSLLGLELNAAVAFGLIAAALLRLPGAAFAVGLFALARLLAALHRITLALLLLPTAAGAGVLGLLLLSRILLLLAGIPGLVGHGSLLLLREVAGVPDQRGGTPYAPRSDRLSRQGARRSRQSACAHFALSSGRARR